MAERAIRVLNFLYTYIAEHGVAPTYREIGRGCQISSTSLVRYYLDLLEVRGFIKRHKGISRGIVLLDVEAEVTVPSVDSLTKTAS